MWIGVPLSIIAKCEPGFVLSLCVSMKLMYLHPEAAFCAMCVGIAV